MESKKKQYGVEFRATRGVFMIDERVVPGKTEVSNVQKHIARYNNVLNFCDKKRVCDLSCGVGYGTWLISQVATQVLGVDISSDAVDTAQGKYQTENNMFVCGDLETMDIPICDVIVSLETIEHLDDPEKFIKKCYDSLDNGGILIYSVPLNEDDGFNPYHKRTYSLNDGLSYAKKFNKAFYTIQDGINFSPDYIADKKFTYLMVFCFK